MNVYTYKNFIILFFTLSITACGGGGSSTENTSTPTLPLSTTPEIDYFDTKVPVDSISSDRIASYSVAFPEAFIELSQLFLREILVQEIDENSNVHDCANGGIAQINWKDNDNSTSLSSGDIVSIKFENCRNLALKANINGTAEVSIIEIKTDEVSMLIDLEVNVAESTSTDLIKVEGAFDLSYGQPTTSEEYFTFLSDNQNLSFTINEKKETVTYINLEKRFDEFFHYSVNFKMTLVSEELEGYVNCNTTSSIKGIQHAYPYLFNITCNGKNEGYVKVSSVEDLYMYVDPVDTIMTYTSSDNVEGPLSGLYSGDLFDSTISEPINKYVLSKSSSSTDSRLMLINPHRMLVNEEKSQVYLTGVSTNEAGESFDYLNIIDLDSMSVIQSIETPVRASRITYSNLTNKIYLVGGDGTYNEFNKTNIFTFQQDDLSIQSTISYATVASETPTKIIATANGNIYLTFNSHSLPYVPAKLVKISNDEIIDEKDLGISVGAVGLDKRGMILLQHYDDAISRPEFSMFEDLPYEKLFAVKNIKLEYNKDASASPAMVKDNLFYTSTGDIFNLDDGSFVKKIAYYTTHYLPELNIAIEVEDNKDPYNDNDYFKIISLDTHSILGLTTDRDVKRVEFISGSTKLAGNKYLVGIERVKQITGFCPCDKYLVKIPLSNLY